MHNRNKGRQISEQPGPLAANWNTKFLFILVKRNNWFLLYPFRNKSSTFNSSDFPSCSFRSDWGTNVPNLISRSTQYGTNCSQSNFSLDTVRTKLFLFTAVRNALFPFGSNCSYSCPTGTELFLIEVVVCSTRQVLCSAYINGNRFRICDKGTSVPFLRKV